MRLIVLRQLQQRQLLASAVGIQIIVFALFGKMVKRFILISVQRHGRSGTVAIVALMIFANVAHFLGYLAAHNVFS